MTQHILQQLQHNGNFPELPKPQPELPPSHIPDAPVLPPDRPLQVPVEKPIEDDPPSEIPESPKEV